LRQRRAQRSKVFWFFFSKKNCFLLAAFWIASPQGAQVPQYGALNGKK
jgi:hypothetical protein